MASVTCARGTISVSCLFVASLACAVSMVTCHWLFDGPSTASAAEMVSQYRSERDRLGDELNRVQSLLTQTQAQLWQVQSTPLPRCQEPQPIQVRHERRQTPVFWPEWTIR